MLWFYVTPVVFAPAMVPQGYQWLLYLNPMAAFLICWRGVFLQGSLPLDMLAAALGYGALACLLGHRVYTSLQWRLAEVV
jgi:ABC-type polysaccharide/polyol phosphate export permease